MTPSRITNQDPDRQRIVSRRARYDDIEAKWHAYRAQALAAKNADAVGRATRVLDDVYVITSFLRNRDRETLRLRRQLRAAA